MLDDGNGHDSIKAGIGIRQFLGGAGIVLDIRLGMKRSGIGQHGSIGIDAGDLPGMPRELCREVTISATDIQKTVTGVEFEHSGKDGNFPRPVEMQDTPSVAGQFVEPWHRTMFC